MRIGPCVCLTLAAAAALGAGQAAGEETQERETAERLFQEHDTDGDGALSADELPEWSKTRFARFDADDDGSLSREEVLARLSPPRKRPDRKPRARRAPEGVRVLRDLEYARVDGKPLKLDLYLPEADATKRSARPPLLVWIHGGGWRKGDKASLNPNFARMLPLGYAAASINYRLEGVASHPDQIHDVKGAVRWLRANAGKHGYDATRIGVGGSSAGGHLALLLGLSGGDEALEGTVGGNLDQSSRVQAVVDVFGPADLGAFASDKGPAGARRAAGMKDLPRNASPVVHVDAADPPVFIFHGDADRVVPLRQSERMFEALRDGGVEVAFQVIPGAGHGGARFSDLRRLALVREFLDWHIKGERRTPTTRKGD